ncbi:MAG TPA: YidC/Oxa1 family insertase periplasmic-domain containing protein [Tepidisphaeraceae bacterium]|jgi:YidC/Oxa1 family membrane protein insertase
METRRLIIGLAVGLGLIFLYQAVLLPWIDHRMHWDQPPRQTAGAPAATQPSTQASTAPTTEPAVASSASTTAPAAPTAAGQPAVSAAPASAQVVPATQPSLNPIPAVVGASAYKDKQFALQLEVQPLGAGVGSVILNDFRATARGTEPYTFQQPLPGRLDTAPLGSHSITINGSTYDLAGVTWSLIASSPTSVTYGADLIRDGTKLLELKKTYTIFPRSNPNLGFEVRVEYQFSNPTGTPEVIRTAFNGPVLPPPEGSRGPDRQVVAGYPVDKETIEVQSHPIEEFKADKDNGQINLTKDKNGHVARWAGAVSTYFAAVVLPLEMSVDGKQTSDVSYISDIVAQGVNIDQKDVEARQAYLTFTTTDLKVNPNGSVTLPMAVYLGPKAKSISGIGSILETSFFAGSPRHYDQLTEIRTSMCGISICTFGWLATPIQWLLIGIHYIVRDWGLAIIGLVAIVRLLLHPITRQSQISMSKMSKMGPEMKRLQEKHKDDKDALNKAMMEFHREQGLGPYLGCLPMFLQMPIWIALYAVLQSTFELRGAPFLWGWTWIHDLSQPDYVIHFQNAIALPLLGEIRGINLLPVLLAVVMGIQQQFMPKPVTQSPEQAQTQKMMMWLSPAMFLFIFYGMPSGLNLYIFTSTAVGLIESKVIRDHIKQREEAEKAGRVFIETKPTRGSKKKDLKREETPSRRGLVGWLGQRWAKLLEQAEQVRQDPDRRGRNGRRG